MKRLGALLILAIAPSAFAGLTYKAESNTAGMQNTTIAGTVSIDGSHMRMDVTKGDNAVFSDNSIVLSNDGGKTLSVYDPSAKTYFDLQLDQILGGSNSLLNALGSLVKISFENPNVAIRDEGASEALQGYPTHKYVLDASYDMNINAMGQQMVSHLSMTTESWTTDQLSSEMSSFLQMRGMRTGIESIDKLIEAKGNIRGFPLKEVSTMHMDQGAQDITMVTTATVSDIQKKDLDASIFNAPAGYNKVDDPVTKMMKAFKK
ncbi:MAG TPA: DUF4412 domain-containing protein [Thermoanaerobaculia bacterium]|nr:DUF4412 domain-containing protein [Thermoanaerobaculia bacterium]